ncbi:replicative DNA helicase [Rhodococcus pyridinivorans]
MNLIGNIDEEVGDLLEANGGEFTLTVALLSLSTRHLVPQLLERIGPDDFADPSLGAIWGAARTLQQDGKTITRRSLLGIEDNPTIRHRLKQASGEYASDHAVNQAAAETLEMAKRRRLFDALKRSIYHAPEAGSYSEALHFASEQIASLSEATTTEDTVSFADAVARWQEWVETPKEHARTIPTPWESVNEVLAGGLHPGRTYVVGGRPGEGKSIALLNFAQHAAEHNHPAVIFSVEMGETEVVSRILAAGARAEYGQITKRDIDGRNYTKIAEYIDSYAQIPLTLVDKSDLTVEQIASRCRTLKRTQGLDVIVVDYLQLLKESDSRAQRERQVAMISRALKILARELDCAVIVACQLNRNAANADRKPALSELRESGAIEQDADVVILLHHEQEQGIPTGIVEFVIAKNRTGKTDTIPLEWRAYQARVGERVSR